MSDIVSKNIGGGCENVTDFYWMFISERSIIYVGIVGNLLTIKLEFL